MSDGRKVKPSQPGGVRDYLPPEMIQRQRIFEVVERVYKKYGFDPLETPALERRDVLTGDRDGFTMSIFRAIRTGVKFSAIEAGAEDNALRFDLTVPLARVVAANLSKLQLPFKRYQVGKVWRGEKPQAGRFSEFTQFDVDIVGSSSSYADAEIIAIMYEALRDLGFTKFIVKVNNRKILNALPEYAGFSRDDINGVLRVLDRMDKEGSEAVRNLLLAPRLAPGHDTEPGMGLSLETVDRLMSFVDIKGTTGEVLDRAEALLKGIEISEEGIRELREVWFALDAMGVPKANWVVDLSIARGLDYYTGPVFETFLTDLLEIGSVFSGGRYDGLVTRFTDAIVPATGTSMGVDRLFYAMQRLGLLSLQKTVTQVLVTVMDPGLMAEYLQITQMLRAAGVNTAVYLGENRVFKAQISYAAAQMIPVVIILGKNEVDKGTVQIKDMTLRKQQEVLRTDLVRVVKEVLSQ